MFGRNITHCLDCGKRFNLREGAYLISKPDGYICKTCHDKREMATRKKETGTTQSDTAMYIKTIVGLLLIAGGVVYEPEEVRWNIGFYILFATMGCALIAWAVIPYFQGKKVIEDQKLNEILSKPLDTFGDLEIRELKKKYNDDLSESKTVIHEMEESQLIRSKSKRSISEYASAVRDMEKK